MRVINQQNGQQIFKYPQLFSEYCVSPIFLLREMKPYYILHGFSCASWPVKKEAFQGSGKCKMNTRGVSYLPYKMHWNKKGQQPWISQTNALAV